MKKTVLKVLALCMSLFCIAGCFVACGKKHDDAIVIGLSGPTTEAAATYGLAVQNSAQMAVDEINAAGGLKNGVKLYLAAYDDKHDPTLVANNYAAMDKEGMQVALGCVTTNPCLEFVKLSNDNDIFFLTPSASGNAVVTTGDHAYQMCFADDNQGEVVAKIVNDLAKDGKLGKLGVLYKSGDPYSEGIYNRFKATLDSSITHVYASFEGDDNTVDLAAQVTKLQDCDFIFMPIYYTPAALFMNQAKAEAGIKVYYGCDGFDGLASKIDLSALSQKVTMLTHFTAGATEGAAKTFVDKYTAKFGTDTLNQFGAAAYDCVYAIVGALEAAIAAGEEVDAKTTASEMCEILKAQFNGGYTLTNAVTGKTGSVKWTSDGFVDKQAICEELN